MNDLTLVPSEQPDDLSKKERIVSFQEMIATQTVNFLEFLGRKFSKNITTLPVDENRGQVPGVPFPLTYMSDNKGLRINFQIDIDFEERQEISDYLTIYFVNTHKETILNSLLEVIEEEIEILELDENGIYENMYVSSDGYAYYLKEGQKFKYQISEIAKSLLLTQDYNPLSVVEFDNAEIKLVDFFKLLITALKKEVTEFKRKEVGSAKELEKLANDVKEKYKHFRGLVWIKKELLNLYIMANKDNNLLESTQSDIAQKQIESQIMLRRWSRFGGLIRMFPDLSSDFYYSHSDFDSVRSLRSAINKIFKSLESKNDDLKYGIAFGEPYKILFSFIKAGDNYKLEFDLNWENRDGVES